MKKYPVSALTGVATVTWMSLFCVCRATEPNVKTPAPAVVDAATETGPQVAQSDDEVYGLLSLQPITVTASAYKLRLTPLEKMKLDIFLKLSYGFGWQLYVDGHVLTPERIPQRLKDAVYPVTILDRKELQGTPSATLLGAFSSMPEFNIPRESNSVSGHPYSQGVGFRGVGISGRSTLVLLDGVPFNDPFDGSVAWAALPREGLFQTEFVPGGGATAWGNAALGGVVQLFTLPARGVLVTESGKPPDAGPEDPVLTKQVVHGTTQFAATFGELGTTSAELVTTQPTNNGVLQVLGRVFSTNGFSTVSPGQRGSIDLSAGSTDQWIEARWRLPLGPGHEMTATIRGYEETGEDGTPYQHNSSRGTFASIALASDGTTGVAWNGVAYVQGRSSASTFSFISDARTAETPLIDQFAAPATAFGAAWTGRWRHVGESRTNLGVDIRYVRGEARENAVYTNGQFTRELVVGGRQGDIGIFVLHNRKIASSLRVTFGTRIDVWNESDGHQRAIDRFTRAELSADNFTNDNGIEYSPSLGLMWQPSKMWRLRANVQNAFRRPTLSELYQPFGHDNIVTEANPRLRTENNTSSEVSVEYTPASSIKIGAKVFSNELRYAISSVTSVPGSSEFLPLDDLPIGYIGRKWVNLDRAYTQGLELSAGWHSSDSFSFDATVLLNDATIDRATMAPSLVGKQMVGVSRRLAVLGVTWRVSAKITLKSRVRLLGPQFGDNENTIRLGQAIIADFGASYAFNKHAELFITVENLANAQIEADRSSTGLVYTGSPRLVLGGLRLSR